MYTLLLLTCQVINDNCVVIKRMKRCLRNSHQKYITGEEIETTTSDDNDDDDDE